jgi:hypothetical protein
MHRSNKPILFDHVVRTGEQRGRDFEADRPNLQVDQQIEFSDCREGRSAITLPIPCTPKVFAAQTRVNSNVFGGLWCA